MPLSKNIAQAIQAYKAARRLSVLGLAEELGIAPSSLQGYLKGTANPRADTIEQLADKMGVPVKEMVSGPAPEWEQAETITRAARELSDLAPEQLEEGIQHFLALVALFAKNSQPNSNISQQD